MQAFQLGLVALEGGGLWVLFGEWILDPAENMMTSTVETEVKEVKEVTVEDPQPEILGAKVLPEYQRQAYEKTQQIQQKIVHNQAGQAPVASDVMELDGDSDVQSEEEVWVLKESFFYFSLCVLNREETFESFIATFAFSFGFLFVRFPPFLGHEIR